MDSPNILIFFGNTGNKGANSSTGWIGLARVANNQAVANEGWIARYFPPVRGFSRTNLRKSQEQKDAISAGPTWDFLPQLSPTSEGWRKINEIMLLAFPLSAFRTKFTTLDLKRKLVCHPNGNCTRTFRVRIFRCPNCFWTQIS